MRRRQSVTVGKIKQLPLKLDSDDKRSVRTQFGALCWRKHRDEVQVLLITSRGSGRWVLPKGWPQDGATPAEAAMTEAWEEAGVTGKIKQICLGIYSYSKEMKGEPDLPCVVAVFPVKVTRLEKDWPEAKERKRRWFPIRKAAAMVREPELAVMLKKFDPAGL